MRYGKILKEQAEQMHKTQHYEKQNVFDTIL